MMTLAYADPVEQPTSSLRGALRGLVVFAVATLADRASIWVMMLAPPSSWPAGIDTRDVLDHVLPPIAAAALLWVVLRTKRTPRLTRTLVALCVCQVVLAIVSIAYWSVTVLPRVWTGRGVHHAIVWEAELVHVRLLPVAWPLMVAIFARTGLPTPRTAAAALTVWSIATWGLAASATAALWQKRGLRAFSLDMLGYTVAPAWTFMLVPIVAVGLMLWLGAHAVRLRQVSCIVASLLWFAAALLRAWYDERLGAVRDGQFSRLLNPANGSGVVAELISDLVLWQIAPLILLLFLARPRHA